MVTDAEQLDVLRVDLGAGVLAGFTTRAGGASPAPWDSLNLGTHVGDDLLRVAANRRRVADWAGAPVAWVDQVHGSEVHLLTSAASRDPSGWTTGSVATADALVSTSPTVAIGILVADCVPILLADARVGVVAAVHAGRSGLVAGVVESALAAMQACGADPTRVRAVIGPAVCGACYEVPAALRDEVCDVVPEASSRTLWDTPALDLPSAVAAVLARLGVGHVVRIGACTMTDGRFFSHRLAGRAGTSTGRFAGVVRAPGVSPRS